MAQASLAALNRTSVELKHEIEELELSRDSPLNRTSVELKLAIASSTSTNACSP